MNTLFCFYDMAVSPCSYDFFTFLYSAETCRLRRGLDNVKLIFIQGPKNRFRDDEVRTNEQNETFFDNVVIPGMSENQAISVLGRPARISSYTYNGALCRRLYWDGSRPFQNGRHTVVICNGEVSSYSGN